MTQSNPFGKDEDLFGREELKDVFAEAGIHNHNKSVSQFAVTVPAKKLRIFKDLIILFIYVHK